MRRRLAAVVTDDDPAWHPAHYGFTVFGRRHALDFPIAKLTDLDVRGDALLAAPNPFALVTAAHLYTRRTRHAPYSASRPSGDWCACSTNATGAAPVSSTNSPCSTR